MARTPDDLRFAYKSQILEEFYNVYGRPPKQREIYKGVRIGEWLKNLRQEFRNGKLTLERINTIAKIDKNLLSFELFQKDEYHFVYMANLLSEFLYNFKRKPKKGEKYKNENLGDWFNKLRSLYNKNQLSQKRIIIIMNINKNLLERNSRANYENDFIYMLSLLKEFKLKYGRLPKQRESYKNRNVGTWIISRRQEYKKQKLSERKVYLLNSVDEQILNLKKKGDTNVKNSK